MTIDPFTLANKTISQLTPYQPGKPIAELERELGITSSIKLASNENPLGPSPKAIAAAQIALTQAHTYPDGYGYELKEAICKKYQLNMNQLTLGNGSENILELICKTFLSPNVNAVASEYAFLIIPLLIKSYGAELKKAQAVQYGHDVDNLVNAIDNKTRVVFLVNPNNPTGTYTTKNEFESFVSQVPSDVIIVIDEAYSEYITNDDYPNALDYVNRYPNMIVSRTFSKAYGLAGLRVGFAVASPEVTDLLNRARLTFNVNLAAMTAAKAALEDTAHTEKTVNLNTQGLAQVSTALVRLHLDYIPSLGNFITINVGNGLEIYNKLLLEGIIIRPLSGYNMPQHVRVTIGTKEENDRFITGLEKLLPIIEDCKKEAANG